MSLAASTSWALNTWSWPGCPNVTDSDFTYTTIARNGSAPDPSFAEPTKMAFDMDSNGNVDIYVVEIRPGIVKRYRTSATSSTVTFKNIVKLPNWTGDYLVTKNSGDIEEGVTGIALDPNFKTNRYVYIHWSPAPATDSVFLVSRFTMSTGPNGDTILMSSEKDLLTIPAQRDECCHTGGAMDFDAYGDLWIAQGANSGTKVQTEYTSTPPEGINETLRFRSEEWGASCTHGLRGGIIRIHPDSSARGYSIPSGNFGEYFAQQTGNSQYLDTSKVLPEIYIKGTRNAYSLSLDPVRRWVVWGDVGPDNTPAPAVREEENMRKTPGFEGWPYFVGKNFSFSNPAGYSEATGTTENPDAPTNNSIWNTGLKTLPPARPTFHLHTFGPSAITGPIYRYNGALTSAVKFPPHFTRKWFVTDHDNTTQGTQVYMFTLDSLGGDTVMLQQAIFTNHLFKGPTDFKAGPDGALYVLNYGNTNFASSTNTSIERISYNQASKPCSPATPTLEQPNTTAILNPNAYYVSRNSSGWWVNLQSGGSVLVPEGMTRFEIFDLTGRKIWEIRSLKAGQSFNLPTLKQGAFKYRWVPE